ncbi:murein biosynthesis integral membrane protein MurJ [uncultured Helicobacter sp.]|uniref:murein biosynthesis integral membrane protein MurJ n=1 Tax=uncultured Helicobacter sp. TaxID=175537 RepID=UPI00374FB25A
MIRKAFLTNSIGTLCSRIFGLVRDLCMASFLGAGILSDIFFVAFKFPNLCRRIFAEGSFVQSFLPNFIQARKKGAFSVLVFGIFFSIILLLSLFVWHFSGLVTKALANGFSQENIDLAKPIVAINFWYLELIFVATFLSSLLQYKNCFWVSAYNTALLNVCMIIALFFVRDIEDMRAVYILSYGVLCGGLAQIALHFYPLFKLGYCRLFSVGVAEIWYICRQKGSKQALRLQQILQDIRAFFTRFLPAVLGSSTAQIASFLDTVIASYLSAGAISYLYYANRIFQLPLALFAIAISTALFPTIAKAVKNAQYTQALNLMKNTFWFLLLVLWVCVIGGVMLKDEITWLLFERNKFLREDTLAVGMAFGMYMLGLLPYGLARIFSLWLYAHNMQGKAAKISAISLLCGVGFSLMLMYPLGASGLALASSLGGVLYFALTIRIFGVKNFIPMLKNTKGWVLLAIITGLEILILYVFKLYEHYLGILV